MMAGVAGLHPDKYNSMCGDINNALSTFMPDSTGASSSKTRMKMVIPGDVSREVAQAVEGVVSGGGAAGMGGLASLANAGVNGDSMVAHMSPEQFASLGTDNPMNALTGLPQAFADDGMSGNPDDPDDVTDVATDMGQDAPASAPSMTGDTSSMGPTAPGVSPTTDRSRSGSFGTGMGDPTGKSFSGDPMSPGQVAQMGITGLGGYGFGYSDGYSEGRQGTGISQVDSVATALGVDRDQAMQAMVDAAHSHNPTAVQNAINEFTERSRGITQAGGFASSMVDIGKAMMPGAGAMTAAAAAMNALMGEDERSFEDKMAEALGGPSASNAAAVDADINDPTAGMSDPVGAVNETVGGNNADPGASEPPTAFEESGGEADPKAQDMGYTGAEMKIIADNYGSVSDFEVAFRREFGRDIVPADMLEQEVLTFLNTVAKSTKQAPTPMST